jgi:hypothetical protein
MTLENVGKKTIDIEFMLTENKEQELGYSNRIKRV